MVLAEKGSAITANKKQKPPCTGRLLHRKSEELDFVERFSGNCERWQNPQFLSWLYFSTDSAGCEMEISGPWRVSIDNNDGLER